MKQRKVDNSRDWAVVIYSVLGLALFAFPGGVLDSLEDRNADGFLWAPILIVKTIDELSNAVGLSVVSADLRRAFATQVDQDQVP